MPSSRSTSCLRNLITPSSHLPASICTNPAFGTRFECQIGDLAGGDERNFRLSFRTGAFVNDTISLATETVRMTITADQHDPYLENNQAKIGVASTNGIFDLALDVDYPDAVDVGATETFRLSLENRGPDAARFVALEISQVYAPSGFEFLSVQRAF
jgi:hypothetical protein